MFTKFNRVLLASGLVLTSLVGFGSSAFANPTNTESGGIGAELPEKQLLTWTPDAGNVSLTAYTAQAETKVGVVNVESNDIAGFIVTVTSTNKGILKTGTGTTDEQIAYTLHYGETGSTSEVTIDAGTGQGTAETKSALIVGCASEGGCNRDVSISATKGAINGKAHGIYTDTLTFTLTNN
jgi:hypothetical protein